MTQKMVNGQLQDLTPEEQAEYDARQAAYNASSAVQARLLSALAARRYAVEVGGITVNGQTIATDDRAKVMANGAAAAAQKNASFTTKWKTSAGFVTLNAAAIIAIADAVAAHVDKCFESEATVAANIANYTTAAQVIAAFDQAMGA